MITKFKIFENVKKVSFIPNELIPYFEDITDIVMSPWIGEEIGKFLDKLLMERTVEFSCYQCLKQNEDGVGEYTAWTGRNHKGLVKGFGYDYNYQDKIYLTLTLNRILYKHEVDVNKPITVYGDIPDDFMEIINNTNMLASSKKYNI